MSSSLINFLLETVKNYYFHGKNFGRLVTKVPIKMIFKQKSNIRILVRRKGSHVCPECAV